MIDQVIFSKDVNFQGTKGLVYIGDEIVVIRRDANTNNSPLQVDIPGGGRENDESPFETFKREVKEELGLDIQENEIIYSKKYIDVVDSNNEAYFIVVKPPNIKKEDIIFGDEGLEFFLIKPEEFCNLTDAVKKQQDKVAEYLNFLK